ncbi:MAG: S8 family serine peptidase [Aquamicrobium sp.]|nr:S8 family serine peptidase [Aquamicrobium sp.]
MARISKLHEWMCLAAMAIVPAGSAGAQEPVFAQDGPEKFLWRSEVFNRDDVQAELGNLFVTLRANGAMTTKGVSIVAGETPTDAMIRNGVWPHWLKNRVPINVDAMLCELNPDICRAGTKGGNDWTRAWPGRTLNLPDVSLELSYKLEARQVDELTSRRSDIEIVETPDFLALWCRDSGPEHELCQSNDVVGGWAEETPAIYQYVYDGTVDVQQFAKVADPSALQRLGSSDSYMKMVAVPVVEAKVGTREVSRGNFSRVIRDLSDNVMVEQKPRLQSFFPDNARLLYPMGFVDKEGKPVWPWDPNTSLWPISIAHFDATAELNHCAFRKLMKPLGQTVALKRWNYEKKILEEVEFAETVAASAPSDVTTDAGPSCGQINPRPLPEKSHGTHTLGLLISLLTLDGQIKTPEGSDRPPVTIYHVPIDRTQTNEGYMAQVEAAIRKLPLWGVSIANVSVSWSMADTRLIDKAISTLQNTIVVAAAGNDDTTGCIISPACIDSSNVISVIGLDLGEDDSLKILQQSNYGPHHKIGAIGANLIAPVDGGMVGPLSGTSQAAPLVSAAIGHLIRRGMTSIEDINQRLMATAVLDSKLLEASKATMIDMRRAMDFGVDFLDLNNGCKMRGEFRGFVSDLAVTVIAVESGGHFYPKEPELRRVFYNEREDWHLIMSVQGNELKREAYYIASDHLEREFRFKPETLENCSDLEAGAVAKFKLADVRDLMLLETR